MNEPASLPGVSRLDLLDQIEAVGVGSFWATDKHGKLAYLSASASESLGHFGGELVGKDFTSIFTEASLDDSDKSQRTLPFQLRSRKKIENLIVQLELPGKAAGAPPSSRWWRISGKPYFDRKDEFQGYRGNSIDITAEFVRQREAALQSQYDELTGLANRRRLGQRLTSMLAAFKVAGRSCALMMLDLDRFKQVNDTMGHPAGDELLKQVADRLRAIVKERGEIGRLGGDEFQIILPDLDDRGDLGELASRIIQMLSQPYSINGRRAIIGTSIGVAIAPYDGITSEELNSAADLSLYAAKGGGRGTFRFYTAELRDAASRGHQIEENLRDALEKGELSLNYQPLVDPNSNLVRGFEALMRWSSEDVGTVSPAIFIPVAEQTDLIVKLGNWALKQACMDAAQWPGHHKVAVNVSAKQFMNADFRKVVRSALKSSRLDPARLELEITESVFVGEVEEVDKIFASLKRLGVRLVMDDFGTGYSSLGYLKRAPFDKIKIDQGFVRGCTERGDTNPAIITAIVALAKALGMETVAEGVEAMYELKLVKERGADLVQGHIFSRPLKQEEVIEGFVSRKVSLEPSGPPKHRADRYSVMRKIGLIHEDHYYDVVLRNLSKTGARIEGLAGVPIGTQVVLDLRSGQLAVCRVAQSNETSQGVEFESQLVSDGSGGLMTRHRVSPYALAEAGMPLTALGSGAYPLAQWTKQSASPPKFIQLSIAGLC